VADHGTYERSQQHYRLDGKGWVCEPCKKARSAYVKRQADAHRILRERHRGEYLRILNELEQADEQHQ
jgi:hypothetical protein